MKNRSINRSINRTVLDRSFRRTRQSPAQLLLFELLLFELGRCNRWLDTSVDSPCLWWADFLFSCALVRPLSQLATQLTWGLRPWVLTRQFVLAEPERSYWAIYQSINWGPRRSHLRPQYGAAANSRSSLNPTLWLFSGWNWVANKLPCWMAAQKSFS